MKKFLGFLGEKCITFWTVPVNNFILIILTDRIWEKVPMSSPSQLPISYDWQNRPQCQFQDNSLRPFVTYVYLALKYHYQTRIELSNIITGHEFGCQYLSIWKGLGGSGRTLKAQEGSRRVLEGMGTFLDPPRHSWTIQEPPRPSQTLHNTPKSLSV